MNHTLGPTAKVMFLAMVLILRMLRHLTLALDSGQESLELGMQANEMTKKLMREVNK